MSVIKLLWLERRGGNSILRLHVQMHAVTQTQGDKKKPQTRNLHFHGPYSVCICVCFPWCHCISSVIHITAWGESKLLSLWESLQGPYINIVLFTLSYARNHTHQLSFVRIQVFHTLVCHRSMQHTVTGLTDDGAVSQQVAAVRLITILF